MAAAGAVVEPTMLRFEGREIEVAAVVAPRNVMRELAQVFGTRRQGPLALSDAVIVLPTCQRSAMELVNWGDDVAAEKDRLLEAFAAFARDLCAALHADGHWADFIDPCSGLPALDTAGATTVYDEVMSHQTLLKYELSQAGPCKVLLHPRWGSAVYPATCVTDAPADVLLKALAKYGLGAD